MSDASSMAIPKLRKCIYRKNIINVSNLEQLEQKSDIRIATSNLKPPKLTNPKLNKCDEKGLKHKKANKNSRKSTPRNHVAKHLPRSAM